MKHGIKPFVYKDLGFQAVCHPDWQDSLEIFLDMAADYGELKLFRQWLKQGDSCIDLGANVGLYTFCLAENVGPEGEVLAVDADNFIVQKTEQAASLLGRNQIQAVHAAISNQHGEVKFYVSTDQRKTFEQSLTRPGGTAVNYREMTVPALTIANLVTRLNRPDKLALIKVDIEGAEAAALQAAPNQLLSGDGPLWQVEINPGALARFKATPRCVTDMFKTENFECWLLPKHPYQEGPGETAVRRLNRDETFTKSVYYNLICIPRGDKWKNRRENLVNSLEGYVRKS